MSWLFTFLLTLMVRAIVVVTTLPVHEFAHGYVAYRMGDPTAKYQGRLTLNPLAHLDLFGTIMLMFTGFGFAKPVPINPYNFKKPKVGMALTALAGPVANVLLALVVAVVYKLLVLLIAAAGLYYNEMLTTFLGLLRQIVYVSVGLAVFNLLPVPPLDGSRIAALFLKERTYFKIMQYENYIFIALFVLLFTGILDKPLNIVTGWVYNFINFATSPLDLLIRAVLH